LSRNSIAVWLAPSIIGTPAIAIWTAYYKRRFVGSVALNAHVGRGASGIAH
jgi:hypothetical protein